MSVVFRYALNVPDGTMLHSSNDDAGNNYLQSSSAFVQVVSRQAVTYDTALHTFQYTPPSALGYMSVRITTLPSTGFGVFTRGFGYASSIRVQLVGSTLTLIAGSTTIGTATVSFAAGDKLGLYDDGTNVSVYYNDVQVIAPVASAYQSGAPGVGWYEVASGADAAAVFTEIDFSTTVVRATQAAVTTQPSASTQTGNRHAAAPVVTIQTSGAVTVPTGSYVTASLIPVTGTGTALGTITQRAVNGVTPAFADLRVNSPAGGTFKWRFSAAIPGGAVTVDSNTFTITASPLATADAALVTGVGGDTALLALYDARSGVTAPSNHVTAWDDYRGSAGYGPSLTGGSTSGNTPLYDGTAKTIETNQSGSQNWLASGVSSVFDVSNPRTLVVIGTFEASQDFVACFQSATHGKFAGLWSGIDNTVQVIEERNSIGGATALFTTPSTSRIVARVSYAGAASTGPGTAPLLMQTGGKPSVFRAGGVALATGSWLLALGGTTGSASSPTYSHSVLRAVLVLDHELLASEWDAILAWAVAQHAATIDASTSALLWEGNSITAGTGASITANSTYSKTVAHFAGLDAVNMGISSQNGSTITDLEPVRLLPAYHASRPHNIAVLWGEGTNEMNGGSGVALVIAEIKAWALAAKARGFKTVWGSILPYFDTTGARALRTYAVNAYFRANWATYFDAIADVASIPAMADPSDTTYYNGALHPTDAGHNLCANDATYGFTAALTPLLSGGGATPSHLVMDTPPTNVIAGGTFASQPRVTVRKNSDGTILTGEDRTVALSLDLPPGDSGALTGTVSMMSVSGVAQFSGVGVSSGTTSATGYTVTAS